MIQRRGGNDQAAAKINFTKKWSEYQHGFGDLEGEFWFGNDFIHELTNVPSVPMSLRIELEDFNGTVVVANYENFRYLSNTLRNRVILNYIFIDF